MKKISHLKPNQLAPSIYIMKELCFFSLDQWEISIHLLWGKCFNIPHHCDPHLNQTKLNGLLPLTIPGVLDDLSFGLWFLDILIKICYSFGIFDHFHLNQSNSKPYVKDCWPVLIKIWKVLSNIFNRMAALHMFCKRKVCSGTNGNIHRKIIFEMTH